MSNGTSAITDLVNKVYDVILNPLVALIFAVAFRPAAESGAFNFFPHPGQ